MQEFEDGAAAARRQHSEAAFERGRQLGERSADAAVAGLRAELQVARA